MLHFWQLTDDTQKDKFSETAVKVTSSVKSINDFSEIYFYKIQQQQICAISNFAGEGHIC